MLVVFDLDGTLIDSTRALLESHKAAWKSVGVKCPPKEDILNLTGLPLVEIMIRYVFFKIYTRIV